MLRATGGVVVTLGATSTYGHLDTRDVEWEERGARVLGTVKVCTVATGILSGVTAGASITVDGTAYAIDAHRRVGDGGLTEIELGSA